MSGARRGRRVQCLECGQHRPSWSMRKTPDGYVCQRHHREWSELEQIIVIRRAGEQGGSTLERASHRLRHEDEQEEHDRECSRD